MFHALGSRGRTEPLAEKRIVRLLEPANSTVTHIVRPRYVRKHFASLPPGDRFFSLMGGQFRLPTKDYPPRLCTFAPLARPGPD